MTSVAVIRGVDQSVFRLLCVLWVSSNGVFWFWWLQPSRVGAVWLYALFTLAWAYEATFLPTMYLYFVGRMRQAKYERAPAGLKVALITLCVPDHESLAVIVHQIEALSRVRYPHDSWILDEGNDPQVRAAAKRLGVHYFSRRGLAQYNQNIPPFKAKTKAGNVNAWLDLHGHQHEFFVQFDIDHLPQPEYLDRVLGYFRDKTIGWVQAPSLYSNLDNWVARGSAEQELVLQGPLQRGFYGNSETPFIIGSHCTYRTRALMEIGGFQPTRAEDHLDTVVLAAHGYRGVFVPEVLALGTGPETFDVYLRQQFAWALSMMQVLFAYTPRLIFSYSPMQALQFLFAQTWYPLWSLSMLILFMVPLAALATGDEPTNASLSMFLVASIPLKLAAFVVWRWTRRWHLPAGLGLSWRGIVLHVARWPIVFWALLNVLLRIHHPYMITPKGHQSGLRAFPLHSQAIYLGGIVVSVAVVWVYLVRDEDTAVGGYTLFALLGAVYMLAVVLSNFTSDLGWLLRHGLGLRQVVRLRGMACMLVGGALILISGTTDVAARRMVAAATWTPDISETASGGFAARQVLVAAAHVSESPSWLRPSAAVSIEGKTDSPFAVSLATLDSPVLWGAYDPWQQLRQVPLAIEHWYVAQDDPVLFKGALLHAAGRMPLLTIEPFPHHATSLPVLQRTISGQADTELHALAALAREAQPQTILLRWGHEMDLTGLYPWAANDPALYRAAFRHVVSVFRADGATNVRWVWSPAGDPGATTYYPGADVVDYVGLTVLGDADWDWDFGFTDRRSFSQLLAPRYAEVQGLDKPILLAEVGVSGSADEQLTWLTAANGALSQFPLVRALVYFNDRNTPNNQRPTQPEWQVAPSSLLQAMTTRAVAPVVQPD